MGEKITTLKQLRQALLRVKGQLSVVAGAAVLAVEEVAAQKQDKLAGLPGQAVGFDSAGNAAAVQGWSNRTLLDNWHFVKPINQRGKQEYVGTGYGIDRWKSNRSDMSVTLTDNGIQIVCAPENSNAGDSVDGYILQRLDVNPNESFRQITISALIHSMDEGARGGVRLIVYASGKVAMDSRGEIGAAGLVSKTFDFSSISLAEITAVDVRLTSIRAQKKVIFQAAKVELGSQQTLAHQDSAGNWVLNDPPPNKAYELAKCQRYYQKSWIGPPIDSDHKPANRVVVVPVSTNVLQSIMFPHEMRATPTISFCSVLGVPNVVMRWDNDAVIDQCSVRNISGKGFAIGNNNPGFELSHGYSFHWEASADL